MSIDVSFHNHGLTDVRLINEEITTLDIYDNPDYALGTRVIMFFNSPQEVARWAEKILVAALTIEQQQQPTGV